MKRILIMSAVILMGALLVSGSGQAFAGSGGAFEKLDYGDDLYGLPNIITPSMEGARNWDKLTYGDEIYGLPNVATPAAMSPGMWDKLDLGGDSTGLATLPKIDS
ncbi:MAG: hypothetical protein HQK85_03485 [Nitrospinae bacterium]|nr:hypothetical protein [Nitrospinota bacterium]